MNDSANSVNHCLNSSSTKIQHLFFLNLVTLRKEYRQSEYFQQAEIKVISRGSRPFCDHFWILPAIGYTTTSKTPKAGSSIDLTWPLSPVSNHPPLRLWSNFHLQHPSFYPFPFLWAPNSHPGTTVLYLIHEFYLFFLTHCTFVYYRGLIQKGGLS